MSFAALLRRLSFFNCARRSAPPPPQQQQFFASDARRSSAPAAAAAAAMASSSDNKRTLADILDRGDDRVQVLRGAESEGDDDADRMVVDVDDSAEKQRAIESAVAASAGVALNGRADVEEVESLSGVTGDAARTLLTEEDLRVIGYLYSSEDGAPDPLLSSLEQPKHFDSNWFVERAKYIPLRLTYEERRDLRLIEAALNVSEYTDKVDILSYKSKTARIHAQITQMCSILTGLCVASDYKRGQELVHEKDFAANAAFFQSIFEIGRRYKIMNPEKMRSEYGKLTYMLMDSAQYAVRDLLQFKCVVPVQTVSDVLERAGCVDLLRDPLMAVATAQVHGIGRSRAQVQHEIKVKEQAIKALMRKYATSRITPETIQHCLYSVGDNHAFLLGHRAPVDAMIYYLKTYFKPDEVDDEFSLAIASGRGGARLSHPHSRQYMYALQSLTLWREIAHDFFRLWYLAEQDLLDEGNPYRLTDTGQGLQRVQSATRVGRAMAQILQATQRKCGAWIGSSVVHLGDHNVPNALMFIDKYTQVSRILSPIVLTVRQIDSVAQDPHIHEYIRLAFKSCDRLRKMILCDFFRHAFDGSGADNFYDAGSCIDGRLTSAWNWCSQIEKKPYYPIFKLTGFVGFDGEFR